MMFEDLLASRPHQQAASPPDISNISAIATTSLESIKVAEERTRPINSEHVQELLDSIAAVGLAQPIAVDSNYQLIAGGHRLVAIQRLKAEQPKTYEQQFPDGVPCRVFDFDALAEPERAETIEIAENEKRRDYTPAEVKAIAKKYIEQGYAYSGGRPKAGEKPLIPALQTYFRLGRTTIKKYLAEPSQDDQAESSHLRPLSPKARKIKANITKLQQVRSFLASEKAKGVRSLDNVLTQLEEMLQAEQTLSDEDIDF